jgi:hypothetical protein
LKDDPKAALVLSLQSRVDEDCDGLISSEGLMEIFESLGHALSVDDAMLLMKKMTAAAAGGAHGGSYWRCKVYLLMYIFSVRR